MRLFNWWNELLLITGLKKSPKQPVKVYKYNSPHYIQLPDGFECVIPSQPFIELRYAAIRIYSLTAKMWIKNMHQRRNAPAPLFQNVPVMSYDDLVQLGYLVKHVRGSGSVYYFVTRKGQKHKLDKPKQ